MLTMGMSQTWKIMYFSRPLRIPYGLTSRSHLLSVVVPDRQQATATRPRAVGTFVARQRADRSRQKVRNGIARRWPRRMSPVVKMSLSHVTHREINLDAPAPRLDLALAIARPIGRRPVTVKPRSQVRLPVANPRTTHRDVRLESAPPALADDAASFSACRSILSSNLGRYCKGLPSGHRNRSLALSSNFIPCIR